MNLSKQNKDASNITFGMQMTTVLPTYRKITYVGNYSAFLNKDSTGTPSYILCLVIT